MPSLELPKGHKVLESGKEPGKGFYRRVQRPNGTVYKIWDRLFSPAELQSRVDAANRNEGQLSRDNIIGNTQAAMGLAAATGAVGAGAYYNMGADRQAKLKRLARGAAFGKTRPQGVGVKTQAGSAGDVRGRVVPDRPPAIVRSADSFKGRGPAMPQNGNLFSQPKVGSRTISGLNSEPQGTFDPVAQRTAGTRSAAGQRLVKTPKARNPNTLKLNTKPGTPAGARVQAPAATKSGVRYAPAGTAKATGKGTRGVPRPAPRPSASTPKAPVAPARPTPLNPNRPTPLNPGYTPTQARPTPLNPNARPMVLQPGVPGYGVVRPDGTTTQYAAMRDVPESAAERRAANGEAPKSRIPGAKPSGNTTPSTPTGSTKTGTRYAPAGTARATGKGTRGVPRPAPRSNFKPATGAKPTGNSMPTRPTPLNPNPPGRLAGSPLNPAQRPVTPLAPLTGQSSPLRPTPLLPGNGRPAWVNSANNWLSGLSHKRTGIKQVDAMMQASDMIGKFGDKYTEFKKQYKPPREYDFFDSRRSEDEGNAFREWEKNRNKPAPAAATPAPAASGGNAPSGGTSQKPSGPAYFPEAGRNGSAVRTPDSYLGEAFDYSLQKGTNSGTKYLEHMFRRDKVSEDDQQRLRERFNKKVVGDQTLSEYGAKQGITKTLEGKKSGLGEALLGKYRDTGTYKGNTDYDVMRAAAEARMARK